MDLQRQFLLFLWKNWTLQKRKCFVTLFDLLFHVGFAVMVFWLRIPPKAHPGPSRSHPFSDFDVTTRYPSYHIHGGDDTCVFIYAPNNTLTRAIMHRVEASFSTSCEGMPFPDEESLLLYNKEFEGRNIPAAVLFDGAFTSNGSVPKLMTVKIRLPGDGWRIESRYNYDFYLSERPSSSIFTYLSRGFLSVQLAVMTAIIEHQNADVNISRDVKLTLRGMPYVPFFKDSKDRLFIGIVVPLVIAVNLTGNALAITKNIISEKEKKLKESMKMMGLSSLAHWSAWFVTSFIYLFLVLAIFAIGWVIPVPGKASGGVLGRNDGSLFFAFLLCYAVSVIAFCFVVSVFFKKGNSGAAVCGVLFLLSYLPSLILLGPYYYTSQAQKIALCLIPNVALSFGCNLFALYEGTGKGAHWGDIHRPATIDDDMSLLLVMVMLLLDAVIFLLITWYVDAVFPGEFGEPQPFYFPVLKSYWLGTKRDVRDSDGEDDCHSIYRENEFFESEPTGLQLGISIRNLRKEYGRGKSKNVAVRGTSLNIYKGQITALLGHNGAGKTTTMAMLTGYVLATKGTAIVNGFDVNKNIAGVRESLGLCPQHDILFDTLTVREHLIFFAKLKGIPQYTIEHEVREMVEAIGLHEKGNCQSMHLSGGQKRKLSVGIALIGGSQVVILDEPTSGMDPQARREMWTFLKQYKENRTILFTTHQMDEADIVGDRIAIMAEGVLKCYGTPFFLKSKYGSGYQLTMEKGEHCDIAAVTGTIQDHVPSARLKNDVRGEPTYILPCEESPKFERLFHSLEEKAKILDISSFGLEVTTMEDVFLRVGESVDDNNAETVGSILPGSGDTRSLSSLEELASGINLSPREFLGFNHDLKTNKGMAKNFQQFQATFVKKAIHTWRNPALTLVQIFLTIFLLPALAVISNSVNRANSVYDGDRPPLPLTLSQYGRNYVVHSNNPVNSSEASILDNRFLSTFETDSTETVVINLVNQSMDSFYTQKASDIGVPAFNRFYLIGGSFHYDGNSSIVVAKGEFNFHRYQADAIALSSLLNALLKYYVDPDSSVLMINHPLPRMGMQNNNRSTFDGLLKPFCILFGLVFLTSTFVIFLIRERKSQAKHSQTVSGLRPLPFWIANFSWDCLNYLIACICLLIALAAFQGGEFLYDGGWGISLVVLLAYSWSRLHIMYLSSFVFRTPACAMISLIMIGIITGILPLFIIIIMSIDKRSSALRRDVDPIDWVFGAMFPSHCVLKCFNNIRANYACLRHGDQCHHWTTIGDKVTGEVFSLNGSGIGRYLLLMFLQGICYFGLVLLIEYGVIGKICRRLCPPRIYKTIVVDQNEDSDVAQERERVDATNVATNPDNLILHNLSKHYGTHLAVDKLCLGVPNSECFGLLGVNGAGKSCTFKMLTGEEMVSDGDAFIYGYDIRQNMHKVHESIAYCPQSDALIDQMTGRETLTMYARIRGITRDRICGVVKELLQTLCLDEYADKEVQTYSGGNKRKLSTAIALIGDPPVIFLDEPSAGVDPAARRQLWNVLSNIRASGRTLILASHSMEECDAVCTRIAIMVNGRFVCLGSPQHLKKKFGQGYTLIARVGESDTDESRSQMEGFRGFLESTFPRHQVLDSDISNQYVSYQLTDPNVSLSYIFGKMELVKLQYNLEEYTVSQTSLQQVFLRLAQRQIPPMRKPGLCGTICCRCCPC